MVVSRVLFEGFALQAVDEKGRVAIPADLRAALDANADTRQIVVTTHRADPCLSAYDTEWSKVQHAKLELEERIALEQGREVDTDTRRRLRGIVEKAPYDASGRFVLPPYFRQKAKIERLAFFAGSLDTFDIWAPEQLLALDGIDEQLRDICAFYYHRKVKG
ncbi:division/cell wall cluster transcriptional repressor MraZ [Sphingomonas japonica]|uniref:division/cell wall cluster transcriptional repressor MraZ n=1 Tax=Sphingomonas japonica TaxID=511662 RepID=UPI00111E7C83|nr:division/cell wall cluster transcriptional repressor MraZ [Sphingomonas japonica]